MAWRSGAVRIACVGAVLAGLAISIAMLREPLRRAWREELLRRATSSHPAISPRLVARGSPGTIAASVSFWPQERNPEAAAAALLAAVQHDDTAEGLHTTGVALFIAGGEEEAAAERFRAAASREPRADWWSDLAAAEIRAGEVTGNPERYVDALEATNRALALDRSLPQAHFNRALIIEKLGFERAAATDWKRSIALEHSPAWSRLVREHVGRIATRRTAREQWQQAYERITTIADAELARLVDDHPQEARTWSEMLLLAEWARRALAGDATAELYLRKARWIADRIAARSREQLLRDAVAAIDRALRSGDRHNIERIAAAHVAYFDGRVALSRLDYETASRHLETARAGFTASGSPMAGVALQYVALAAINTNRIKAARVLLAGRLALERDAKGHAALVADLEYLLALCDAILGRWGDALITATSSRDAFQRIGERANTGDGEMLIGSLLALLGRPHLAWPHHIQAAKAFSAAGEEDRMQVCAGTMNQVEMKRHRWRAARALSDIELFFDLPERDRVAAAYLRAALADWQSGDLAAAASSLRKATEIASSITDADVRQITLSDIAALEGRILAGSNPSVAVARLTRSIEFQKRIGRTLTLPDLNLVRGRVHFAMRAPRAALADFEEGIRSLEDQRMRVREYELRAGLFDDARALFSNAVTVSLELGDVKSAFGFLERGRARSLLDELAPDDPLVPRAEGIAAVQKSLAPGTLLLSYALLSDRIAIFVVDRSGIDVRFSAAPAIRERTASFIRAVQARQDVSSAAQDLYDALLLPVGKDLERATKLVIVPDPALEGLPFAALYDRRTRQHLVESHELLFAPSAAVFVACSKRIRAIGVRPPRTIALFANPTTTDGQEFRFLPAADAEASTIAQRYAHSLVRRRDLATAKRFREEAVHHDVVQYSGHAAMDPAEPWKSGLMMDVRLTSREIAAMHFPRTQLAIVAACSTVGDADDSVEATSGIARSFLMAGVPAVIGTLWDVDDAEAAILIGRVHERLAHGVAPARALREAQVELIRNLATRHPAVWASFTIIGADVAPVLASPAPHRSRSVARM